MRDGGIVQPTIGAAGILDHRDSGFRRKSCLDQARRYRCGHRPPHIHRNRRAGYRKACPIRQHVAGMEPEVLGDEGTFLRRGIIRSTGISGEDGKRQRRSGGGVHQRSQDPHGASSLIFL